MAEFSTKIVDANPSLLLDVCRAFEEQYDLDTEDFHRRYSKGEFVGVHDALRWATYWEAYLATSQPQMPIEKGHSEFLSATG